MIEFLQRLLFPTRSRGARWLRERLQEIGVRAPLSPSCVNDFVMNAADAALAARSSSETYAASLRKQLDARASFIHRWTTTDEKMDQPEWNEWAAIARRHLLPRSWTITQTSVTESHRDLSFAVPERLIVKGPRSAHPHPPSQPTPLRPLDSANDLPGSEILSDLKRAGDKS